MPVIRIEKNTNYTTMSNYHLRDQNLSLKAKGLLSLCLSLPEDWCYSINGLAAICKEGRSGIASALKELEQNGYLLRERCRDEKGKLRETIYVLYERPQKPKAGNPDLDIPALDNPDTVKPDLAKPALENRTQLNKDRQNKDIQNTESTNKREKEAEPRHRYGAYGNVLLTDSDFVTLQSEFPQDYKERIERLSEYMASTGKSYKSHLATIRCWARRDQKQSTKQEYSHENYRCRDSDSL